MSIANSYKTAVVIAHAVVLLALPAFLSAAHAESFPPDDKWHFAVKPYMWLPNVNGTLRYEIPPGSGGGPTVDLGNYILQNLSFAMMVSGEARKGDWAIVTDIIYLDVNSQNSTVKSVDFAGPGGRIPVAASADLGTNSSLSGELWELFGAYTMARNDVSSIDILSGFRYLSIEASTSWQLAAAVAGPGPGQSFGHSGSISQRTAPLGLDRRRPRVRGAGQRHVGHSLLSRRGCGFLICDVASSGRHRVQIPLGRCSTVLSVPLLQHEGLRVAEGCRFQRTRARREFPLLTRKESDSVLKQD